MSSFYCTFSSAIWSAIASSPLQFLTFFFWKCFWLPFEKLLVLLYTGREKFNFFRKVSLVLGGNFEHITSIRTLLEAFFIRSCTKNLFGQLFNYHFSPFFRGYVHQSSFSYFYMRDEKNLIFFRKVSPIFSGDFEHITSTRTLLAVFLYELQ